jgi:hypothetical protein
MGAGRTTTLAETNLNGQVPLPASATSEGGMTAPGPKPAFA